MTENNWQLEWCATNQVAGVKKASANESVILYEDTVIESKTQWSLIDGIFFSSFDSNLVLDVAGSYAEQNTPVNLYYKTGNPNQKWRIEKGYIYSELSEAFVLAIYNGTLVIQKKTNASQKWMWSDPTQPRPATSCYMYYSPTLGEQIARCASWKITLSVKALEIVNGTYFCSMGWPPGGYSGIQQKEDNDGITKRYVIFSFWNNKTDSVSTVDNGDGVVVKPFGGEGTGMKCIKQVPWELNEPVTFEIDGKLQEDQSWIVSCYITANNDKQFIASLQRGGPVRPLSSECDIYSFAEDWERYGRKTGYRQHREAEYSPPFLEVDNESETIRNANFTKVSDGCDAFAIEKAHGGARNGWFYLSTGGLGAWDCDTNTLIQI